MTDDGIEEIYSLVDAAFSKGQKSLAVHVFPFRMTAANTKRHAASKWAPFWSELKAGYDAFEAKRVPPGVSVNGGHYVVQ
jgi:murein L,D-transpeptidase YafK